MNTKKICRCCLALDVPLLSIYDGSGSTGSGCVADMLNQIAKVKPQPNDNMPDKTCMQCISEINRCFVFKIKCENSNRTLRQLLPDAVPETLEYGQHKAILTSSAVQTDEKIHVSTLVQTVKFGKPSVSHSSVQTLEKEKILFSNKETQTEIELSILNDAGLDDFNDENIIIYEKIESPLRKRRKTSPANKRKTKKITLESNSTEELLTIEATEQSHNYILLEESKTDSEETEVYIQQHVEKEKKLDYQRFEYCDETEVGNETEDDEIVKSIIYENDEYDRSDYHIDSSKTITKSTEKQSNSTENCRKSSRTSNKPKGQYKCTHCIMTFVSLKVLKRHLIKVHDIRDTDIIVDYIPATETDGNSAAISEDPSSSDNCTRLLQSINEINLDNIAKPQLMPRERVTSSVNEEMLTNAKYFCEYCQAGFAQRKTYTYHTKHKICLSNNFKCNKCDRIFVSEQNLEDHQRTHENPHKCLECEKVCKTMEELSQHMIEQHNRNARNQCHVCKKVFTMKTSLVDHLRIHSGEKPFLCTICGKSFRQYSNLRQHLVRHTNEKNFKCDMCPNAYVTKAELFSHKRTHTGDHPFKCDVCQARFTTSCSLRKHVRKHTGERPYACELCPMRFAALNVLKNHIRIHTGEKPFKCASCPKSFTQKGDCLMHERSHSNKDFKCFCDSKFTKKSNFRHHLKTQHAELSENEVKALLEKSRDDNESADYQVTLLEGNDDTYGASNGMDEVDSGVTDELVTISQESDVNSNSNNEELLEIVMENVG